MNYLDLDKQYYLPTFKRYPIVLDKGRNSRVWDIDGNEYIDAFAGIAVSSLGHNHPAVVSAIKEQAEKLIHTSNFFLTKPQALLSQKLVELSGMDKVFFANSGAEANEGAIKLARKYGHSKGKEGNIISFNGCFHGRTLATIAMGKEQQQKGFEPMPAGFKKAEFNNLESVENTVDDNTVAIIVEPIQGEGGINAASVDFLKGLRKICDERDIVLIFDEIQCGVARTGNLFAKDFSGVQPDIMTSAKALGSGVPVSAILTKDKIANKLNPGDHGTTFGGNPLATAAALATINAIEDEKLADVAKEKGKWFVEKIKSMKPESIGLKAIRGRGLMIGLVFDYETKPLADQMLKHGVLANATAGNVIRMVPPITIPYDDLEKIIEVIFEAAKELKENE
jgi:acetylornithine/N-succinyldiaminopimelate aminotransferase